MTSFAHVAAPAQRQERTTLLAKDSRMPGPRVAAALVSIVAVLSAEPALAAARASAQIAGLQAALHARGFYSGPWDGIAGPQTTAAITRLQRHHRLTPTGRADRRTRASLGRLGRPSYGSRPLRRGMVGLDVSALQFELARHGFVSGGIRGYFGLRTEQALRSYQRHAGLPVDGRAGAMTFRALRSPPPRAPYRLAWPAAGRLVGRFGPRGMRFSSAVLLAAPLGTPVAAAAGGRVAFAGWRRGGYGYCVAVDHAAGVRTWSCHLARVDVQRNKRLAGGELIGLVGWTGRPDHKPHLRLEVRVRGAAVDPLTAFG